MFGVFRFCMVGGGLRKRPIHILGYPAGYLYLFLGVVGYVAAF